MTFEERARAAFARAVELVDQEKWIAAKRSAQKGIDGLDARYSAELSSVAARMAEMPPEKCPYCQEMVSSVALHIMTCKALEVARGET